MISFLKKYNLQIIFIALLLLCTYSFYGQFLFLKIGNTTAMPMWCIVTLSCISLVASALFIFFAFKKYKINIPIIALCICALLFITNLITILLTPECEYVAMTDIYGQFVPQEKILVLNEQKIIFIFRMIPLLLLCDFLLCYLNKIILIKTVYYCSIIFLIITLIFMLISIISESSIFVSFFKNLFSGKFDADCKIRSIFFTSNNFGLFLTFSVFASIFTFAFTSKARWLICLPFIYAFIILTQCKSSYILAALFILAFFIYKFFETYKKGKKRSIIIASSIVAVLIAALIPFCIINSSLLNSFIENATHTFELRSKIWSYVLQLNNHDRFLLIGRGLGVSSIYINKFNPAVTNAHNLYISIYGFGGLMYLLAFLSIISIVIVMIIRYHKVNKAISPVLLMGIITICLYWVFEG